MFFNLFIAWNSSVDNFYKFLDKNLKYETKSEDGKIYYISSEYTVYLHLNETTFMFKEEDYNMKFNILVVFNIRPNTNWPITIMEFVNKYLCTYKDGAFLLEYNGDTSVVLREKEEILVDDSKFVKGLPLWLLNVPYKRKKLKNYFF